MIIKKRRGNSIESEGKSISINLKADDLNLMSLKKEIAKISIFCKLIQL